MSALFQIHSYKWKFAPKKKNTESSFVSAQLSLHDFWLHSCNSRKNYLHLNLSNVKLIVAKFYLQCWVNLSELSSIPPEINRKTMVCLCVCLPACLSVLSPTIRIRWIEQKSFDKITTIKYTPLGRRRERLPINDPEVLISIIVPQKVNSKFG